MEAGEGWRLNTRRVNSSFRRLATSVRFSAVKGSPAAVRPCSAAREPVARGCEPRARIGGEIFATRFRVAEYCRTVLEQRQALDGAERPARADVYALVVRRDYRVFKLDLEPEPGRVLEKVLHGSALDVALDGVRAAPEVVQGWFAEWVRLGAMRLA